MHTEFLLESLKAKDHPEDLGVDRRIILKYTCRKIGFEDVDLIHLVGSCEDRN
jgi:hypothetical protein